jgi:polyisoprenoid-binding protein YceI
MRETPFPPTPIRSRKPGHGFRRGGGIAIVATLAWPVFAFAAPETWRFDPVHSQVWFSTRHQDFSHPQGRLRIKDGWFQFDEKDWGTARVDVAIDLASLDLGDAKWNETVKSGQFLDVARWPIAHFVGRRVERIDATHGVIHGDLALHGTTRPVDVAFTLNRIGNDPYAFTRKAGFSASATLQRFDFGIKRYGEVVGKTIDLRFEIEGIGDGDVAKPTGKESNDGAQK